MGLRRAWDQPSAEAGGSERPDSSAKVRNHRFSSPPAVVKISLTLGASKFIMLLWPCPVLPQDTKILRQAQRSASDVGKR
jgi:hypothetical protein